jgi:predicted lipoprotein with Yx(FWY)xxD motif
MLAVGASAAGCGAAIPGSNGAENASVKLMQSALGPVLTDGAGHTLYLFEGDEEGESYCNGACASVWPPYESDGHPRAMRGVEAAALGTVVRDGGETQVTYQGHPLYFYAGDASVAGRTNGQELEQFGDEWYAVGPNGKPVEHGPGGSYGGGSDDGGGSNDGGGGY